MPADVRLRPPDDWPLDRARPRALSFRINQLVQQARPSLPLIVLVLAVSTDRFGIHLAGLNLRFELIAAAGLALWVLMRQGLTPLRRAGLVEWCLAGWLAVALFASVSFSPGRGQSVKFTALLAGLLLLYAVTFALLRTPTDVIRAATAWVAVGAVVAAIGLVDALLNLAVNSSAGISFEGNAQGGMVEVIPKVHSTMWEPNIFASYLLTVWLLAFALSRSLAFQSRWRRRGLTIAIILACAGITLSQTRAAWVSAGILLVGIAALALKIGLARVVPLLGTFVNPSLLGFATGLLLALVMSAQVCPVPASPVPSSSAIAPGAPPAESGLTGCQRSGSAFFSGFHGLVAPGSQNSAVGRLEQARLAIKGWLRRPIFGWGSGAYTYVYGPSGGGWLGNLELHILFDTGLVGLILLGVALAAGLRYAFAALLRPISRWSTLHLALFGVLAGSAALAITYQLTEGTWLGFTWVFFAMLVAAGRLARKTT